MKTTMARARWITLSLMMLTGPLFGSSISLINSYWSPADFDDDVGPGLKLQASLSELYDLEFRTSLFPDMGEDVVTEAGNVTVDLALIPLEFGFVANIPYIYDPLLQPYFGAGFGYYMIDLSAKGPAGAINYKVDDEIGFYLVGGGRLHLTPELIMVGECMYRIVEGDAKTKNADGTSSEIGMKLNGFGFSIGLGLFW